MLKFATKFLKSNMRFVFALAIILFLNFATTAQKQKDLCPKSENEKAVKYYEKAYDESKGKRVFEKIKEYVEKSAEQDSTYAAPWKLLADIAYKREDYRTMKDAYVKAIAACPDIGWEPYYRVGTYFNDVQKYAEAIKYLKGVSEQGCTDEKILKQIDAILFKTNLLAHPVPFNPQPVKGVSTFNPEYLAYISADADMCLFTRSYTEQSKGLTQTQDVEKFMISTKQSNGEFDEGKPLPPPFNGRSTNNEGGPALTIDNTTMYYTKNEKGNFDIYVSTFVKGYWSLGKNIGKANHPKQWDAQPCITPDGLTLYFTTYRDSVNGTADIYYTQKNKNGEFGEAKPLIQVNTNGNEKSPFMHPDNRTFYFSSDSLPGMGGYDIFMIKIDDSGQWGKPVNLGYPINTEADEVGFFVSTDGSRGYFASNKLKGGKGSWDIYQFDLYEKIKPEKVLFLKGELKDENNDVISDAKLELKNLQTKETVNIDLDSATGKYSHVVLFDEDYVMTVKKKEYVFESNYFSKTDSSLNEPKKLDIDMKRIKVGSSYQLNHVLFKTKSTELDSSSQEMINNLAQFLQENKSIKISIEGHTDNVGHANDNMTLSNNRAKVVHDNLIGLGISASRLSYKGFGASRPIKTNDTEEGRQENRRTQFVITEK